MLQPRLSRSAVSADTSFAALVSSLNALSLCSRHQTLQPRPCTNFVRHASHAAQGRANGPTDSAGRRLGAKKSASEYVAPGNIIFKQRGTKWHPGENVGVGKDHTIYALEYGYVRYYRDPLKHPKRRYIGVALEKEGPGSQLPLPRNAPTRRRLGMYATPITRQPESSERDFMEAHLSANSRAAFKNGGATPAPPPPTIMREGTYREANVSIGRAAERKGISVPRYDRSDRWMAWRKRAARIKTTMESKAAKGTKKSKGKKSNKGAKIGGKKR
ncbi:ribosomal protein L27 [Exophiala oligosperma]|uniref:Large ribosomal subunit protein bL27m n=1 Tax=Exophiala oligosperma TaxID=215243 RepID=A0A0D2AG47_9EURO|nr:ribosomal protein L27 [Exophiala oligosperma]KIW39086.1 ribosomal protein L27 [Exophiala oligosperma]